MNVVISLLSYPRHSKFDEELVLKARVNSVIIVDSPAFLCHIIMIKEEGKEG